MADEVLPAEPVDEESSSLLPQAHGGDFLSADARSELSGGVAPQPEPQSEPGPEPGADFQSSSEDERLSPRGLEGLDEELARLDEEPSPLPGAVWPQVVSEMSVMVQRHAAPAKAKVAARRELAQLASESDDIRDQLADRHTFSNVRYAQKVAEKRRARNRTEGNFMRDARRGSTQMAALRTAEADARAVITGHHTTAHQTAASLLDRASTDSEVAKRKVGLKRNTSSLLYSGKVAQKRAASGLDEGAFARKAKLSQLIEDCPIPAHMSEQDLRLELDLRCIACTHMSIERLVAEVTEAREETRRLDPANTNGVDDLVPATGRKLQYGLRKDAITRPEERDGSILTDGLRMDVPADGGVLAGTVLPRNIISCSKLDRRKDRQKFAAVDEIIVGIPKKRRAETLLSLLPHGCWFPQSGEPVKLFADISRMIRPRDAAEKRAGHGAIVCALRKEDGQEKWSTLDETEKLTVSPTGEARLELRHFCEILLLVVHTHERQSFARMLARVVAWTGRRDRQQLLDGVEAEALGLVGIQTDPADGSPPEKGYQISGVAVIRCSRTERGELRIANDFQEADRTARAVADQKRWLKQPIAQKENKRRCCKWLHRIYFISAPLDQIDVRHRVPTRTVYRQTGGVIVDDSDSEDDDQVLADRNDIRITGEKEKCHRLVLQISNGDHVMDIVFAGFAVILFATCLAAVAATHLSRVAIALLTIVPGGFLLWGVRHCALDCYGNVLKHSITDEASRRRFWPGVYTVWGYVIIFLTLIPMVMMVPEVDFNAARISNATELAGVQFENQPFWGTIGFLFYGGAQWSIGWIFLWWYWEFTGTLTVRRSQRSQLPIGFGPKLRVISALYEGYTYSAFSFFLAIPWDILELPKGPGGHEFPAPHRIMQLGILEFEGATPFWLFVTACVTVFCSFFLLVATVRRPNRHFIVVTIFFDLLAFPMIKQLSSVFACTSATIMIHGERYCKLESQFSNVTGTQCMDIDPATLCWGGVGSPGKWGHLFYVLVVMILLIPYYWLSLKTLLAAAARMSVVAKDGRWTIIAFQSKVVLAFMSTVFGDCHPKTILSAVGIVVVAQLLYGRITDRDEMAHINGMTNDDEKRRALVEMLEAAEKTAQQKRHPWPPVWKRRINEIRERQGAALPTSSLEEKRQRVAELQASLRHHPEEVVDASLMQADESEMQDRVDAKLQKLISKVDVIRLKEIASQVSHPKPYSSVLAINCIHDIGLCLAAFNCIFAAFVKIYSDHGNYTDRCSVHGTAPAHVDGEELADTSALTFHVYWIWLGSNFAMMLCGYIWFRKKSRTWTVGIEFASLGAINKEPFNYQVDFSIMQSRVDCSERLLRKSRSDSASQGREVTVEFCDKDLRIEFYEPGSAFGHVLKRLKQGTLANRNHTLVPGQRLVSVQGMRVIDESLEAVKQRLIAAVASNYTVKLTFTQPLYYRVISKCVVYETIEEYTGKKNARLQLRATADHLKLQKQVCAIGHHQGRSSFVEMQNGMSGNEQTTDGHTYIRVPHSADAQAPGRSYWIRLTDAYGVDMLRKEDEDFSLEVHLYEDSDFSSLSNSGHTDCQQQLEKPSLEYALDHDIPVTIQTLDVANELKTKHLRDSVRDSMLLWHENLTNAPSGQVLIDSLLKRHTEAEMYQRKRRCRWRQTSRKLTGLTGEYELEAICCICTCRCCRLHSEASLTAKIWRCFVGWFDKMVSCNFMFYRMKSIEAVRHALKNHWLPCCFAAPILCFKKTNRLHHPVPYPKKASIQAVHLRGHGIHGRAITAIMSRHIKCSLIDLADCGIGTVRGDVETMATVLRDRGAAWVRDVGKTANVFQQCKDAGAISKLNLCNNDIGDLGGTQLFRAIADLPIQRLYVAHCNLAHESIFELGLLLQDRARAFPANLETLRIDVASSKYLVKVVTASERGAGTDANVTIKLVGTVDSATVRSDWMPLDRDHQEGSAAMKYTKLFERGQEDEFALYCDSVGHVQQVYIRLDEEGLGPDWKLDRVEVWEPGNVRHKAIFDCHSWLRVPHALDDEGPVVDCVEAVLRPTPPIDYSKKDHEKITPYWNFVGKRHWEPQPTRWQRLNDFDWWPELKRLVVTHDQDARANLLEDPFNTGVHHAKSLLLRFETDRTGGGRSAVCHADAAFDMIAKINDCEDKIKKAKRKSDAGKYIDRVVNKWKTRVCEVGMIDSALSERGRVGQRLLARPRSLQKDTEYVYELRCRDIYGDSRDFSQVRLGSPDVVLISCWLSLKHVDVDGITLRSTGRIANTSEVSATEKHPQYSLVNREVWNKAANQRGAGFDLSHKRLGPADVLLVSRFIEKHIPEQRVIDSSVDAEFNLNLAGCPIVGVSVDLDLQGLNHLCGTLKQIKPAELNLSSCGIGPASVAALAHFVAHVNSLKLNQSKQQNNLTAIQCLRKLVLSGNDVTGGVPTEATSTTSDGDTFRPIVYDCVHCAYSDVHQQCMDTELPDWGPWYDLCTAVHDSGVEEFIVSDAGLGPLDCKVFAQSLNGSTTVIDLSGNLITGTIVSGAVDESEMLYDQDGSGLEELQRKIKQGMDIKHGSEVTTINFAKCCLGTKAIRTVAQIVRDQNAGSMSLTSLDLSGCQISSDGTLSVSGSTAEEFAAAIGESITLAHVRLDSTGVPGCPRTYSLCADAPCIDLSYSNLGEADLAVVVAWFNRPAKHPKAKWASIVGNVLCEWDREESQRTKFQRIVGACPKLNDLRNQEAQQCDQTHRPGVHMSAWRAVEFKLVQLDQLGGRKRLQRADIGLLERLDLSGCNFAPQSVTRLKTILSDAHRLEDLSLRGSTLVPGSGSAENAMQEHVMTAWADLCKAVGSRLRRWDLSSCGLTASSIHTFADQVDWDTARLRTVNLSDNPLSTGIDRGSGTTDLTGLKALLSALGDMHDTSLITELELVVDNSLLTQVSRDLERVRAKFEVRHPRRILKTGRTFDDPTAYFAEEIPPQVEAPVIDDF